MAVLKNKKINFIILWLFPIISYYGYLYVGFDQNIMKFLYFISVPLLFVYVWKQFASNNSSCISRGVRYLTLSICFSIFAALFFWDQPLIYGYRVTSPFLAIIFYFFLKKGNFSFQNIELYIKVNAIIWFVLWLYAMSVAPQVVFGYDSTAELEQRGIFRLSISGSIAIAVCYFYYLNKYVKTRKIINLFLFLLCFMGICLQLSRQLIIISFIIGVVYLFKKIKVVWLFAIVLFVASQTLSFKASDDSILGSLLNLTERQYDDAKYGEGDGYVRLKTYNFLLTEYTKNPIAVIVGNGVPHLDTSYGKYYKKLIDTEALYYSDAGYAEIYIFLGVVGLIIILWLFYQCLKLNIDDNYYWLKLFIVYMLLYNIASGAILSNFIYLSLALYLLDKQNKKIDNLHRI